MFPLIKPTSILTFEEIEDVESLKVGDIVEFEINSIFVEDNSFYVHRITKIGYDRKGFYIKTKGDNNFFPDIYKRRLNVLGCKLIDIQEESLQ